MKKKKKKRKKNGKYRDLKSFDFLQTDSTPRTVLITGPLRIWNPVEGDRRWIQSRGGGTIWEFHKE